MQAIETVGEIDQKGNLILKAPLYLRNKKVRIIILLSEQEDLDDQTWLQAIQNPAFDFLKEPDEDIYTINDGKPIAP